MNKKQIIISVLTVVFIIAAYWYYFALQASCGILHSNMIPANPTFQYLYMRCGLFDIYALLGTTIQSLTGISYSFISTILPLILWFPIAVIGLILGFIYRKK